MVTRLVIQTLVWFGLMGLLLFLPAGTWNWPSAWVYLAEMVSLSLVVGLLLAKHDPGVLKERLASPVQKTQPTADKILLVIILVVIFGSMAFMALDAVRFGWSDMPVWVQALGALILLVSVLFNYRTLRENSFAAPVVKIQQERGHTVISTGPYAYVRHPFYVGGILFFLGTPLLLGSWWGLLATLLLVILLAVRIQIEERTLRTGLPGYQEYTQQVRYRLIPYLW
ncbi:MAG TPA: isoprenylcysteine carboxylmethyltransferase family protein [Steroidobacteraceae bacterium]